MTKNFDEKTIILGQTCGFSDRKSILHKKTNGGRKNVNHKVQNFIMAAAV
jgi:hypothetical protein